MGIGGSSVRPYSAIQHVVVERRFAVGCSQVGSGGVCERVEFGVRGLLIPEFGVKEFLIKLIV